MPSIKKIDLPSKYTETREDAGQDWNFCGPLALSIVLDRPLPEIQKACEDFGRKDRRGTPFKIFDQVCAKYGKRLVRKDAKEFLRRIPKPHCDVLKNVTTHHPRRFPGLFPVGETYLMFTKGHVSAVKDGVVQDWAINTAKRAWRIDLVVDA